MSSASEQLAIIVKAQDQASQTLAKIERSVSSMNGKVGTLNTATSKFHSILTGIGTGIGIKVFDTLAAGVQRLVSVLPDLIGRGNQFAETVRNIVETTGMLPQQASVIATAANVLGTNLDSLTTAFVRLGTNAVTSAKTFKEFGVQIAYTNTGAVDSYGTFQNLLNAVGNTGAGALSTAAAIKLMGRGAKDLIPLLLQGADGFNAFKQEAVRAGTYLDGPGLAAIKNLDYTVNRFWNTISGTGTSILAQLAPLLSSFIDSITNFIQSNMSQIVSFVAQAANFIIGVIDGLFGLNIPMVTFASSLHDVSQSTNDAAAAGNKHKKGLLDYNPATKKAAAGTDAFTAAIDKQIAAIDNQIAALERSNQASNAQHERDQILKDITDAKAQLAQVQDESIFAEGMTETQRVLAEQQHAADLIAASTAVSDAQDRLRQHDAQQANQNRIDQLNKEKQALQDKLNAHKKAAAAANAAGPKTPKFPGGPGSKPFQIDLSNQALKNIKGLGDTVDGGLQSAMDKARQNGLQFAASVQVFLGGVGSFVGGVLGFVNNASNFFKPITDILGPGGTLAVTLGALWLGPTNIVKGAIGIMTGLATVGGAIVSGLQGLLRPILSLFGGGTGSVGDLGLPGFIIPKQITDFLNMFSTGQPGNNGVASTGTPFNTPGLAAANLNLTGTPGTYSAAEKVLLPPLQAVATAVSPGGSLYQQLYNQTGAQQDTADSSSQTADATTNGIPVISPSTGFTVGITGTPKVDSASTFLAKVTDPSGAKLLNDGSPVPLKGVNTTGGAVNIVTTGGNTLDLSGSGPMANMDLIHGGVKATAGNTVSLASKFSFSGSKLSTTTTSGSSTGGGNSCFPIDTPISTPDGDKAIGDIRVGDKVYAVNEETLELVISTVTALIPHPQTTDRRLVIYLSGGKSIEVTENHPFYDVNLERFHHIAEFHVGDAVLDYASGFPVERAILAIEDLGRDAKDVYNFEVATFHNYLANGVLVHNIAKAMGGVGLTTGMTDLTVGEAGREAVAVLRNPRPGSFGNFGGFGGGNVTLQVYLRPGDLKPLFEEIIAYQDLFAHRSTTLRAPGGSY